MMDNTLRIMFFICIFSMLFSAYKQWWWLAVLNLVAAMAIAWSIVS